MLCAEWWALEVLAIFAGILGVIELASQIINFNVISILLTTSLGVQMATCTVIGNCIGANNVPLAKRFFKLINYFVASMILMLCFVTFVAREGIAACFSNDEEVREVATTLILMAALTHIFRGT